jgi:hypothetical protein
MRQLLILMLTLFCSVSMFSQTTPFIKSDVERALLNELSGDRAFEHLRSLALWHRTGGSNDYHEAALYIEQKAKEYGLEDVRIVRQQSNDASWSATYGELWVLEPSETKLGSYAEYAVALASNSRTTHVTAPLIDVGNGVTENDYAGLDVKGKIVLTSSHPAAVMQQAVWKRGALGVVSYFYHTFPRISDMVERPDQVAWTSIPSKAPMAKKERLDSWSRHAKEKCSKRCSAPNQSQSKSTSKRASMNLHGKNTLRDGFEERRLRTNKSSSPRICKRRSHHTMTTVLAAPISSRWHER